jgi:hypothetical protein
VGVAWWPETTAVNQIMILQISGMLQFLIMIRQISGMLQFLTQTVQL